MSKTATQDTISQAESLIKNNQLKQAYEVFAELTKKPVTEAEELNRVGLIAFALAALPQALAYFQAAWQKKPQEPAYAGNLALTLMRQNQWPQALEVLQKTQKQFPNHAPTQYNLGVWHQDNHDLKTAKQHFTRAIECDPKLINAYNGAAATCDKLGELTEAKKWAQESLKRQPKQDEACALLGNLLRQEKDLDASLKELNQAPLTTNHACKVHFEKGHTLHKLKRYTDAFKEFEQANALSDKKLVKLEDFIKESEQILEFYQKMPQAPLPHTVDPQAPVYIVASPRSGTTLLAQMLGMHPKLYSAGELQHVNQIIGEANMMLNQPNNMRYIFQALHEQQHISTLATLQARYLELLSSFKSNDSERIIDKLPANARRLGLIARFFPGAPIIHIIRDGREVAFSSFTQNFRQYIWHSHNIEHALWDWMYSIKLARAGAQMTGLPYLEIRYEDLVQNPKDSITAALNFLGLEFDEACLHQENNPTNVVTASYHQVRQKVYTSSIKKAIHYPEVYKKLTALGKEVLEDLGYS